MQGDPVQKACRGERWSRPLSFRVQPEPRIRVRSRLEGVDLDLRHHDADSAAQLQIPKLSSEFVKNFDIAALPNAFAKLDLCQGCPSWVADQILAL